MIIFTLFALINLSQGFLHTVDEGSVGITYQGIFGGKLSKTISEPGTHYYIPIYHSMRDVNIRIQVDEFSGILCTAAEGSKMYFTVHVNNQLKDEKVYDIIQRFGEVYDIILIQQK